MEAVVVVLAVDVEAAAVEVVAVEVVPVLAAGEGLGEVVAVVEELGAEEAEESARPADAVSPPLEPDWRTSKSLKMCNAKNLHISGG